MVRSIAFASCFAAGLFSVSKAYRQHHRDVNQSVVQDDKYRVKPHGPEVDEYDDTFPCVLVRGVVCGSGNDELDPVFMGQGGTSRVYLVRDAQDEGQRRMVVKLLFFPVDFAVPVDDPRHFMTRADLMYSVAEEAGEQAMQECEVGMAAMAQRAQHPEAQRVCGCYGHNIRKDGDPDEILYVKMEEAGSKSLWTYTIQKSLNKSLAGAPVAKIFKMILQGFKAMETMKWVMHDFHSGNVVVEEFNGEVLAQLIDFGFAVEGTEEGACDINSRNHFCNRPYAPPEYESIGFAAKAPCQRPAFDPRHPFVFDMYGVGVLLFEFLALRGARIHGTFRAFVSFVARKTGVEIPETRTVPYEAHVQVISNFVDMIFDSKKLAKFDEACQHFPSDRFQGLNQVAQDFKEMKHSKEFLRKCVKLLEVDPAERPSAAELLDHPFMKAIKVYQTKEDILSSRTATTTSSATSRFGVSVLMGFIFSVVVLV